MKTDSYDHALLLSIIDRAYERLIVIHDEKIIEDDVDLSEKLKIALVLEFLDLAVNEIGRLTNKK